MGMGVPPVRRERRSRDRRHHCVIPSRIVVQIATPLYITREQLRVRGTISAGASTQWKII